MTKVFIADEQYIIREGVKSILKEFPDIKITGEASTGEEALEKINDEDFDIVIMEINLPERSGFDVLKDIKRNFSKLPVLILSMYSEEQFGLRMLKAGASGYIAKTCTPKELATAIRKVQSGGKYISPLLAEHLAFHFEKDPSKSPHERLSDREFQIMRMLSVGKTASEIASELSLSVKTVFTHRTHIFEKMKMESNAQLTIYAKAYNLLD